MAVETASSYARWVGQEPGAILAGLVVPAQHVEA